jgi:thiamine pyrophosphokinase
VIVVAGGAPPAPDAALGLPADAYVIAADSGIDHALALGLRVDLAVGDMDSVSPEGLAAARAAGAEISLHPPAKDQTDLELALDLALARSPSRIVVLGESAGRLDHLLGVVLLLAHPRYAPARVEARLGDARLTVLHGPTTATLHGTPGDLVTLLPLHGPATGITTSGLAYPLQAEDLRPGTTRGISNEMLTTEAQLDLRSGTLLAVQIRSEATLTRDHRRPIRASQSANS